MQTRLLTPTTQLQVDTCPGLTIQQIIDKSIDEDMRGYTIAYLDGVRITDLDAYTVRQGDQLMLMIVPQGGGGGNKAVLGMVLMVAITVMSYGILGPGIAAMGITGMGLTGMSMAGAMAGISLVASLAMSALIRPPTVSTQGSTQPAESPSYLITGQSNQARKYSAVAKVYGTHKVFPSLAANPLVRNVGKSSKMSMMYDFGLGDCDLSDIRIGETPISVYQPLMHQHKNSFCELTYYVNRRVGYDQFSFVLKKDVPLTIRTKPNTAAMELDLTFPQGMFHLDDKGNIMPIELKFRVGYRLAGSSNAWSWVPSTNWWGGAQRRDEITGGTPGFPSVPGKPAQVFNSNLGEYINVVDGSGTNGTAAQSGHQASITRNGETIVLLPQSDYAGLGTAASNTSYTPATLNANGFKGFVVTRREELPPNGVVPEERDFQLRDGSQAQVYVSNDTGAKWIVMPPALVFGHPSAAGVTATTSPFTSGSANWTQQYYPPSGSSALPQIPGEPLHQESDNLLINGERRYVYSSSVSNKRYMIVPEGMVWGHPAAGGVKPSPPINGWNWVQQYSTGSSGTAGNAAIPGNGSFYRFITMGDGRQVTVYKSDYNGELYAEIYPHEVKGHPTWNGGMPFTPAGQWQWTQDWVAGVIGQPPTTGNRSTSVWIAHATQQPFVVFVDMMPKIYLGAAGEYEIFIELQSENPDTSRFVDTVQVSMLRSYQEGSVVTLDRRHTMLEVQIEANEKITGVVQNLSAVATSVLRTTTDGMTFTHKPTNNPAWIALDILTGDATKKPLPNDMIDWASWIHLAAVCDKLRTMTINGKIVVQPRYTCNTIVDYSTTVQELLMSVLSCCRSTMVLTSNGKYGVMHDDERSIPRQIVTPANSWGFVGARAFTRVPHGLRVSWINPDMNWQRDEIVVYNDGYSVNNATEFDELGSFGITNYAEAWAYGRFMLAQGIHRSETFTVNMDIENLAVQRGDLINLAHDVPKIGGMSARVVSVTGPEIKVSTDLGVTPTGYTVRRDDGLIKTGLVTRAVDSNTFELDDTTGLNPDDLIVLGITDRVVNPYLVLAIAPASNMNAELTLVPYVEAVYQADQGAIPPWNPGFGDDLINSSDLEAYDLTATQTMIYIDRKPVIKLDLMWKIKGFALAYNNVYSSNDGLFDKTEVNQTSQTVAVLTNPMLMDRPLEYTVTPVSATGYEGKSATLTITPTPDRKPPAKPYGFAANVQREIIELFWQSSDEPDIDYYELRYTPAVTNASWEASQKLSRLGWQSNHTSAGARTGTYMIKAVDTSGNYSPMALQRTTVETLPDINFIENIDDQPSGWLGQHYLTVKRGSSLAAQGATTDVQPETYYIFSRMLDVGDVYECRISSKLRAYGENGDDIIATWIPLSGVPAMQRAQSDKWDAWLEVRNTGAVSFMSSWTSLATLPNLSGGASVWSDWRPVQVGDFTGNLFQFRIQLRSYDKNIRPVVTSGLIEVDMPDRIDSGADVDVTTAPLTINFDPAFRVVPSIAVSIDGNATGLYADVTSKSTSSFTVQLFDPTTKAPTAGRIDWQAKGYGRRKTISI